MDDLERLIEDVEAGPQGPEVGAFFDFDGTLIAGYSANAWYGERLRKFEVGPAELARTLIAGFDMNLRGADVTRFMEIAVAAWAGRAADDIEALGERLFVQQIAGMTYPESDPLIRAHRRAGHTIAVASSATPFQVAPLARELGIENLLCTEVEIVEGLATGHLAGPVLWGEGKAEAVRMFAAERRLDLDRSYAYGNGEEDLAYLETVGRPRPLNPDGGLAGLARDRDWPTYRFPARSRPGPIPVLRTGAAIAGLSGAVVAGVGLGLLTRSRRAAANLAIGTGSEAALALAGVRLFVKGEEHLWSHRPAVFTFNHQSSLDALVVGSLVRRDLTAVAKKEAARDPRFAPIGLLADVAYIDRKNSTKARSALTPVVEKIQSGMSLAIAPEGTRTPTPHLARFKKGAFHIAMQAGVPIVPIVLRNTGSLMWRGSSVVRQGTVDVVVLPPVATDGWHAEDIDGHIDEIRKSYVNTFEELGGPPVATAEKEVVRK
ncbi:MAG TPA: HAD-IB family hydrolase [Thermoleophilaceae bacterium]|nr:HAD-IB family hydrolase [Thermoleophilaceae bacterium]